uniref:Serine/arginine repetitive matrix 4 n=1 Tax=Neolamprologus brichardi TaxID=32507 RepID=A0A3Q4MUM7_NEOBR
EAGILFPTYKQLFEKFWKGTFKAVATPRPESVIVASITASRRVTESKIAVKFLNVRLCIIHRIPKRLQKCRLCSVFAHSPSFDEEPSPRPKRKKKKRKSERKRKRKSVMCVGVEINKPRSPSYSLSPPRKKKKKKKKSSKRSKRHSSHLALSCSLFVSLQTLSSKPASEILHGNGSQHLTSQTVGPHDYDSGNDTSSPPSSKTGVSQGSVTLDNKSNSCQRVASPGKLKFTERDNVSDSGNSVTSYASLCKPYGEDGLSATLFSGNGKRSPKTSSCSERRSDLSQGRPKTRSSSSRSRSSGSSRYSGRYSRSPSLSSCRYYVSIVRHLLFSFAEILRDRKRTASSRETDAKHTHKVSGKRRRRKSYSPMKKRRRDSPSHLEARRITSARKRPIPYFRPSPSSSSRCTSVSSWSSLFTRSRSRSPLYSVSRSRSRSQSHSYSSYRSYSRSSSWNSVFGSRSRSRSRGSLNKRNKTRH